MASIFIILYNFFKKHRFFFLFFLLIVIISASTFIFRLSLEEDINKAIPGKAEKDKIQIAFQNTNLADKIIFNISACDSAETISEDSLIAFAEDFGSEITALKYKPYLTDVFYKINDTLFNSILSVFYNNYPIFLTSEDLSTLDSIISPENINLSLQRAYESLISPASFAFKNNIVRDPLGIAAIALRKLNSAQFEENYEIVDDFIFTKDHKHILIFANTKNPSSKTSVNSELADLLSTSSKELKDKYGNKIKVESFGSSLIAVSNANRLKKDIILTFSIAAILLILIIHFSVRDKRVFLIIFIPTLLGGGIALTTLTFLEPAISVLTLSMGSIILAITMDYSLHIIAHQKHKKNIKATLKDVAFPIMVCGIATAFEFISLIFVSSALLRELGIFAAISIITSSALTLIILPQIIDKTSKKQILEKNYLENFLDKITHFEFDKNKPVLIAFTIITFVMILFANKVEFEGDMMKMNYMTEDLKEAEANLKNINNFTQNTAYIVSFGENMDEAILHAERAQETVDSLQMNTIITKSRSVTSILVSESTQKERLQLWKEYWNRSRLDSVKANLERASIENGFKPETFSSFIHSLETNYTILDSTSFNLIKNSFYKDNFYVKEDLVSVVTILRLEKQNRAKLQGKFDHHSKSSLLDRQSVITKYIDYLNDDFGFIANVSLLLVLLILIIAFGRIEIGFITFIPILISWVWTLGMMGLLGIKFNIFNIIISSFITGMGVDYSTYVMQGLIQGYSTRAKSLVAFKSNIMVSAMITISGTGVLIFATHPALYSIASISIIGLSSVVLIAYTYEPLLFYSLVKKKGKPRYMPVTLSNLILTIYAFLIFVLGCLYLNLNLLFLLSLPLPKKVKKLYLHKQMMYACRTIVYGIFPIKKRILNPTSEDFKKPALIISNHQSHIDLLILLMLNPKIIVITNNWVWNSPLFGFVIRYIDFYAITEGYDAFIEKIRNKVAEGYSILVFPEGSRSPDKRITRFHKGAFYLAKELHLDVVPIIIHGANDCMKKGENNVKKGAITLKINERVTADSEKAGKDYHEMTKSFQTFYRSTFKEICNELETPKYFAGKLANNYIYKGPILEWYCKIKIRLENYYELFDLLVPRNAKITDIGCGYGFMSYMLSFLSSERKITGIDYDEDKIETANNCLSKNDQINFFHADATQYSFEDQDVFILSDILHYISEEAQEKLITNCAEHLNDNGIIIIRDADKDLKKRHLGTRYTEFFSTKTGFNKLDSEKLHFTSKEAISTIAKKLNLYFDVIDNTKLTSNLIFIISKTPIQQKWQSIK